ncbi:copper chaperone PCu(A)C [Neptunicella sp. SCSIO 80796]|uniref:copper chaperone PCu(A)C n=1 Tax=Neptunicella plasticusilytica TaxID=3117012 RepID=UPI003A4DB823
MRVLLLVLVCLVTTGAAAELNISQAVVRLLPPGVPNTSAYFKIENTGKTDRIIVAAQSDVAGKVELHAHMMHNDMMRMMQQENVIIPAGETVMFEPGGLHLMLFDLKQPLKLDQDVKLTLSLQDGETLSFSAKVNKPESHSHH